MICTISPRASQSFIKQMPGSLMFFFVTKNIFFLLLNLYYYSTSVTPNWKPSINQNKKSYMYIYWKISMNKIQKRYLHIQQTSSWILIEQRDDDLKYQILTVKKNSIFFIYITDFIYATLTWHSCILLEPEKNKIWLMTH